MDSPVAAAGVSAFTWSDRLATGIADVDSQHRYLIGLINRVGDLCMPGSEVSTIKAVLDELLNYTVYHFSNEEQMMQKYAVSEHHQNIHLKAHEAFRKQATLAADLIRNSDTNAASMLPQLLDYLTRWLLQHIMVVDQRMAREITALQAGRSHEDAEREAAAMVSHGGEVLMEALNALYGKIGEKTVEVMQANRALEQERTALRELNEKLEQRVAQRTQELEGSNRRLVQSNLELQQANQRLEVAQGQLMHSEKMAAVGQLAAGVAHEINNPLGFVLSNMSTLERYVADIRKVLGAYAGAEAHLDKDARAKVQEVKEMIDLDYLYEDIPKLIDESRDGLDRVKRIVLDLQSAAQPDVAEWQKVSLEQCLDGTLNVLEGEIKYKAKVSKQYAGLPEVECVPQQIRQALLNILLNAAQSIEGSGNIRISTGRDGDRVWAEVADTGKGIAPEHLSRVFDPFFTTKPVGQGTGLGLSVSYGIVQKHNGHIEIKSELGKGTAVRVYLPINHSAGGRHE